MNLRRFSLLPVMLLLSMTAAAQPASVPGPAPQELIQDTAQRMLAALDADRGFYQKNPDKLSALVDQLVLPNFDARFSAQLVLGKYWRTATAEQRQRFIDAFYHSLLVKYGVALASFTSDRLRMLPFRGDLSSGQATVRTEVRTSDGVDVPVDYSLRATPQGWKAWDVTIEGISYIKNFRTDIGAEVEQRGLDAVISRLESEVASRHGAG